MNNTNETKNRRGNNLGVHLFHPKTGEKLYDAGDGPNVEANRIEFARRWKELGFMGDPFDLTHDVKPV